MILADKTACDHPDSTLVQHDDVLDYDEQKEPQRIWFVTWQCNHCGAITAKQVTMEELEMGNDLPWLDVDAYQARVKEREASHVAMASIHFMRRAVR